ncbi:MAG: hypothetical protein ABJ000_20630 [Saccharospirillum sp.]|uniref:hypothetical protein n=1 Tax=Saccharospirillum sp. TaxID=2033801 RepID=UPI00329A1508
MRHFILIILVSISWASAAFAEVEHANPELTRAYQQYLTATQGDKGAVDEAVEAFEALLVTHPSDPLILVLLGSSQTLQGRDAWMPWNKMSLTEDGLAAMGTAQQWLGPEHDEQVFYGLPVSVQVKALAGITFTQVPDFFGRFEQGYQLLLDASQSPLLDEVPAKSHSHIHFYAARAARQADEPERQTMLLRRLADLPVDNDYTAAARDALTAVGE